VSLPARILVAVAALLAVTLPVVADMPGRRPAYTDRPLSDVPNAAAMTARFWAPGHDDAFVPQGLTFIDGALYVGSYRSEDPGQGSGQCRLHRIDPRTGAVTAILDLPASCGHAGGLAKGSARQLWAVDTRVIFEIALAPSGSREIGRIVRTIRLAGDVKGSFAAGSPDALWLGTYSKDAGARLYKFPFNALPPHVATLSEADAALSIPLPDRAQGAAFDPAGGLWITRSGSRLGELVQIDLATAQVARRFPMPAGIEDISFDAEGGLWAVSEAGSKRWLGWETFFPVIFRLDISRLR
jgi:hypothetical protein